MSKIFVAILFFSSISSLFQTSEENELGYKHVALICNKENDEKKPSVSIMEGNDLILVSGSSDSSEDVKKINGTYMNEWGDDYFSKARYVKRVFSWGVGKSILNASISIDYDIGKGQGEFDLVGHGVMIKGISKIDKDTFRLYCSGPHKVEGYITMKFLDAIHVCFFPDIGSEKLGIEILSKGEKKFIYRKLSGPDM